MLELYLKRWGLVLDGAPIVTHAARLWPVRMGVGPGDGMVDGRAGTPAMLKIATADEERRGGALMQWWQGNAGQGNAGQADSAQSGGAARVLARDGDALLLERATGSRSLAAMARAGQDDDATRILCRVAARLHGAKGIGVPRPAPPRPAPLEPLEQRFRALEPAAAAHGGPFARAAASARLLRATPQDETVLHGDLHHGNVLDFGPASAGDPLDGWRAIDPKGVLGERGFDYAALFTNPDLADDGAAAVPVATDPARFTSRLAIVAQAAGLGRTRLLHWILAWTGLSAAWFLADGDAARAALVLRVGELATRALDQ